MSNLKVTKGNYCIIDSKDNLVTKIDSSSTVLGMTFESIIAGPMKYKFLCHFDLTTDMNSIIKEIKKYITKPDDIQNINIWSGNILNDSKMTTNMAYSMLESLGIRNLIIGDERIIRWRTDFVEEVVI